MNTKLNIIKKPYIFISYAHDDSERVYSYIEYLEKHNVRYWYDNNGRCGDNWDDVIAEHLIEASYVLFFISANSHNNYNVNQEIIMAINHKIVIIPVFIDDVRLAPKLELKISSIQMIKLLSEDMEENFVKLMKQIPEECIDVKKTERHATKLYVGSDIKELKRLKIQSQIVSKFDQPVFDKLLKGKKHLTVLDFGCNDGTNSYLRFNKQNEIDLVLGFDLFQKSIDIGNNKYGNDKFHFYQADLESDNAEEIVQKALSVNHKEKADIILFSYVVLHLKNPAKVFRLARKMLSNDGTVIIIDIDDGLRMYYPDPNGYFDKAIKIESRTLTAGFRNCGRTIFTTAFNSGFSKINLAKVGLTTIGMDYDERDAFFHMCFSYMIPHLEKLCLANPKNNEIRKDYEWYTSTYDLMHEQFVTNDFFAFSPLMIFTAQK